MSAFLMSEASIKYLVDAAVANYVIKAVDASKTFGLLLRENYRSLAYRYPDDGLTGYQIDKRVKAARERFEKDEIPAPPYKRSPAQVVKTSRCYQYQSCEHPKWWNSKAKAITDAIISEAVMPILYETPAYQSAQWD